ncbi:IclR family transcriptional regulator [Hydrogenophaga sp. BPS33]|uniref:IclR family transcriptional regulator n=1 Tax=Hydrogenophaga sp. BPS33 TaxID=2651974 RepID=UPI00131F8313|nr:IclR family transcriptional regulator [Hydrogenophaga sp. BPS33]QHE85498.1 IclR family transcriptional regulator [Hydrogenophaga sp. BPS33]
MKPSAHASMPLSAMHKCVHLLKAMTEPGPHHVSTLVKATGLNKATVIRILDVLTSEGYTVRGPDRAVRLGVEAFVLAASLASTARPFEGARPGLLRLAAESEDNALLSVRSGPDIVCMDQVQGTYPMRAGYLAPGRRLPLGAGSAGVAFLGAMPEQEADAVIDANAPRLLGMGRMELDDVRQQVRLARRQGYALVTNVVFEGTGGIAVPVRDADGRPVAVLSIAGLVSRLQAREAQLAAMLLREASVLRGSA